MTNKKTLLIQPNNFDPIGLKVIGSYLSKNGINNELINYSNKESLTEKLIESKPDFVGTTLWTGSMILNYLEIVNIIRKYSPNTKIVVGGPHASILPEQVLNESDCDFVVSGDGETAMLKITKDDFKNENGILFKENNTIKGNTILRTDSLDLVESIFDNFPPNTYKKNWSDKVVRTYTSKGCPHHCAFCYHSYIDNKMRYKSLDLVKQELILLKEKFSISDINLFDDNLSVNKKRANEIFKMFEKLNINYQFAARIDGLDEEFIKMMKNTGCNSVYLGLESGSDRILKFIDKKFSSKDIRDKVRLLNQQGIRCHSSFMINFPTETKKDLDDTKLLASDIGSFANSFSLYAPYPRTKLFDYINENYPGAKLPKTLKDWADINFFNYVSEISELKLDDILSFCNFFNVKVYEKDNLHKTSI